MSIDPAAYLIAATTHAANLAEEMSVSAYMRALAEAGLMLIAGVAIFWAAYGRKRLAWAAPCVGDRRAAGVLWVGGAIMVWLFLAVPTLLATFTHNSATTRAVGVDGTNVAITSLTYLIGLIVIALVHFAWRDAPSGKMLGLTPARTTLAPGKAVAAALVAWPLTYFVASASMLIWQWVHYEHESAHAMLQLMERNETSPWVLGLTIANAALLAPVFEELLFRGHLQTALAAMLPKSRWPAIVITSAMFALMHEGWTMPAMFTLSLAIGTAYEWSGSLWVAIAIHVAFNATSTVNFLVEH